jgi:hypothetical protein
MKYNLNQHLLDSRTYLVYLFEHKRFDTFDYDQTISEIQQTSQYQSWLNQATNVNIDLYPYLFTLHVITNNERNAFFKFLSIYMRKAELMDDNEDLTLAIAEKPECLIAFITAIQYYFL